MRAASGTSIALGLMLCGAFATAGCERIEAPGDAPREALQAGTAGRPGFTLADPRLGVAHAGIRRLEFPLAAGPARSFREEITTDGHGRYSIQPVDALEASGSAWEEFELVQRAREGFLFRYRDFLVRDPRLFARNWRVTDEERSVEVAGRHCDLHRVERTEGEPVVFELSVDAETGLVLASQELDARGQLVAAMTYESVRFDPDLDAVVWHVRANEEVVLGPGVDGAPEQGTEDGVRLQPRLLPRGYGPLETATVVDGNGARWLKRTYSDGVEPLFFFQALGGSAGGARQARVPVSASTVTVFEVGAAKAIQGEVDGFELMVIGKAPQSELLDLIESALP
jgi:hypothetical protein